VGGADGIFPTSAGRLRCDAKVVVFGADLFLRGSDALFFETSRRLKVARFLPLPLQVPTWSAAGLLEAPRSDVVPLHGSLLPAV